MGELDVCQHSIKGFTDTTAESTVPSRSLGNGRTSQGPHGAAQAHLSSAHRALGAFRTKNCGKALTAHTADKSRLFTSPAPRRRAAARSLNG